MSGLEVERVDGVPVARIREDIDASNVARVRDRLAECVGPDVSALIVDLGETRYLDSAGLDMLLRLSERLRQRRATLMLVIPDRSQLKRLAAIVGLPEAVSVHASLDSAREAAARLPSSASAERAEDTQPHEA